MCIVYEGYLSQWIKIQHKRPQNKSKKIDVKIPFAECEWDLISRQISVGKSWSQNISVIFRKVNTQSFYHELDVVYLTKNYILSFMVNRNHEYFGRK